MSTGSKEGYRKLTQNDDDEITSPFGPIPDSNNNQDGKGRGFKLSRRQKAMFGSFLVFVLVVAVVVSIVFTTERGQELINDSRKQRADRKATLQDVLGGTFGYDSYSLTWVSDSTYMHEESGNLVLKSTKDVATKILVSSEDQMNLQRVRKLSPDEKYFLFANNTKGLYRHSFYADYYVKNLATGEIFRIRPPMIGSDTSTSERFRHCDWTTKDNALVFVYKENIYYVPFAESKNYFQITKDGKAKQIFNGVPDWVYEEEILATTNALAFSDNGRYMAYGKFNASAVQFFRFPIYGPQSNQYNEIEKIAYPKAGGKNPTVELRVIDLDAVVKFASDATVHPSHMKLSPPKDIESNEHYYAVMKFNGDKVFVQWMNRFQNITKCSYYDASTGVGRIVESHETRNGWIDDDYVKPKFSKNGKYYITMLPDNQGESGDFRHLAKVNLESGMNKIDFLTHGEFTVQDINCYNPDTEIVYFRSTEQGARYRQVYSYDLKKNSKSCLSCNWQADNNGQKCNYWYPSFSKECSYVLMLCQGPTVPTSRLIGINDGKDDLLVSNEQLRKTLSNYDLPQDVYYTVKSDGFDVAVRETRPYGFDRNKKYAILFDVYGGPNTQKVYDRFSFGFTSYFPMAHDIIRVHFDARGTGNRGYKFLYGIYRNLGYYETQDCYAVAKYLRSQPYVDGDRMAIWGWSYGGFYSATVLGHPDNKVDGESDKPLIGTAVAVAPVTDWRYYDTVYTERYMSLPSVEDNLVGYQKTSVMQYASGFKGKNFLLIHGTADDNVHFQNSAQLSNALIREQVKFRQQYYPDRDHGIYSGGHIYHLMAEYLCAHLKADSS